MIGQAFFPCRVISADRKPPEAFAASATSAFQDFLRLVPSGPESRHHSGKSNSDLFDTVAAPRSGRRQVAEVAIDNLRSPVGPENGRRGPAVAC